MVVALRVDYEKVSAVPEVVENAVLAKRADGASVVNVHANFTIPEDQRHVDGIFPHLEQMSERTVAAERRGSLVNLEAIDPRRLGSRPFRRPDYAGEWKLMKKAWSLHRNGRDKLSRRQIEQGTALYHADEPLNNLRDWVWRFVLFLGQPKSETLFMPAIAQVRRAMSDRKFSALIKYYESDMSAERGRRYFDLMKEFFEGYTEYSQVYFQVAADLPIPNDHRASSANFNAVKMFYGNAYEVLSSSVDLLAYTNNILSGREFDTFSKLTKDQYMALDKSRRFSAYALNGPFAALSAESDNQIRNASHHGAFHFDAEAQVIKYRAGKGGTGAEQTMSFVDYLAKSTVLFIQVMVIFRVEILMCQIAKAKMPI